MTRLVVGGTPDAVVAAATTPAPEPNSRIPIRYSLLIPGARLQVWQNETGAPRLLDLLAADGTPYTDGVVVADDNGQIPRVQLPDGLVVDGVWFDPIDESAKRFYVPVQPGPVSRALVKLRVDRLALDVTVPEIGYLPSPPDTAAAAAAQKAALAVGLLEVADGGTLILAPGTSRVRGDSLNPSKEGAPMFTNVGADGKAKTVHVDGQGATLIADSNNRMFAFSSQWEATKQVISGPTFTAPTNGDRNGYVTVVVDGTFAWPAGAEVKLFADDYVPDARLPGLDNDGNIIAARVGQMFTVDSTTSASGTSTSVRLVGTLRDTFSINVRIARFLDAGTGSSIKNLTVDVSPDARAGNWSNVPFDFNSLRNPKLTDINGAANLTAWARFTGCLGYKVDAVDFRYAKDDVTPGNVGYGVLDVNSGFGEVTGSQFHRLRHAFTTDVARIKAGTDNPAAYGRSSDGHIHHSTADGCSSTGWDTHHGAERMVFDHLTAKDCAWGIAGRGRFIHFSKIDIFAYGGFRGVNLFTEDSNGGETYGITFDDVTVYGATQYALEVNIHPTGHPSAGVRPAEKVATFRRFKVIDGPPGEPSAYVGSPAPVAAGVKIVNADIDFEDFSYGVKAGTVVDDAAVMSLDNSAVTFRGSAAVDLSKITAGANLRLLKAQSGSVSTLKAQRMNVTGGGQSVPPAAGGAAAKLLYKLWEGGSNSLVSVGNGNGEGITVDTVPLSAPPYDAFATGGYLDWLDLTTGSGSHWFNWLVADLTSGSSLAMLGRSFASLLVVDVNVTADTTLGQLPLGRRRGQQLVIMNRGTANLTINHQPTTTVTSRVTTIGGVARVVPPGKSVTLAWSSRSSFTWAEAGA